MPEVQLIGELSRILYQLAGLLQGKEVAHLQTRPYRRAFSAVLDHGDGRRLAGQAAARPPRPARRAGAEGRPRLGRRRPQALGGALLGGARAQHGAHQQRFRRHGLRAAGGDRRVRGDARRAQGRVHHRRRRLSHERAGARDRQAARPALRRPRLERRRLRPHRDAPAAQVRPRRRHALREPGPRRPGARLRRGRRARRARRRLPAGAAPRRWTAPGPVVVDIPIDYAENDKLGVDLWKLAPEELS